MTPRDIVSSLLLLIVLLVSQVLIFDFISIRGFGVPMIYSLFVLALPVVIPGAIVMLLAFGAGFLLDIATNSGGLHMASLTAMAFARKYILDFLQPPSGYDKLDRPLPSDMGFSWFMRYSVILILVHQAAYYFFERFSFEGFINTAVRILAGTLITVFVTWLLVILFSPRVSRRKK